MEGLLIVVYIIGLQNVIRRIEWEAKEGYGYRAGERERERERGNRKRNRNDSRWLSWSGFLFSLFLLVIPPGWFKSNYRRQSDKGATSARSVVWIPRWRPVAALHESSEQEHSCQ
jgi:hypothetical protein